MHPSAKKALLKLSLTKLLLGAVCLLALPSLCACPQQAGKTSAGTSAADKGATSDSGQPQANAGADNGSTQKDADAATDKSADEDSKDENADGKDAVPEQPVEIDEEKDIQRGEAKTPEPKGVWVDVDFMNATWNEDPEAKLSHLLFNIGADLGRNDSVSTEIKLDDPDHEVYGLLDLRFCQVRVYPYVSKARITRESGSKQEYTRDGRYVFMLLDAQGEGLGVLEMDYAGEFQPAPPEYQPEHTSIVPIFNDKHTHIGYDIAKMIEKDKPVQRILQIRINKGAFVTQQITDPLGNVFVYRFPEIHLLVAPPEVDTSKPTRPT